MAWQIEFSPEADKALATLSIDTQKRIVRFMRERVADMDNPRSVGKPLIGPALSGLWRYRVGDYRILCKIEDEKVYIVVVEVGHRSDVYRRR